MIFGTLFSNDRSFQKNTEMRGNKNKISKINRKQKIGINKDEIRKSTEKI